MKNRKIHYIIAIIITATALSISGCNKQEEPVISESVESIEEPEESLEPEEEEEEEVEEVEEPEEKETGDNLENESNITEEEEVAEEEESSTTGIEIAEELDQMMYVQTSANARSGDNTDYEVVTTYGVNTEVHVTGRTANDWYRVEHSDGDVYVSGKLLGMEKVVVQQKATNGNSGGQQSGGSTASGGGSSSSGGMEVDGNGELPADWAPIEWGDWGLGGLY